MVLQIQGEDVVSVETLDAMDRVLDVIHQQCDPSRPIVVSIECPHDCRVDVGLGDPESIVIIWAQWRVDDPDTYYVSLAACPEDGTKWYWLHGTGDTEFERKHLVPVELARQVVREFVETGKRSNVIGWATEHY